MMPGSAGLRVQVVDFLNQHPDQFFTTKEVSEAIGTSCGTALDVLSKSKTKPVTGKKKGKLKYWKGTGNPYTPHNHTRKPAIPDFSENTENALDAIGRVLDENKSYREQLTELKLRCLSIVSDIEALGL